MNPPRVVAARYELLRRLGRGGSSTVWLACDRADGASVALKWLRRVDPARARQARAEVAALRLLQVPGVVALRDEGEARGRAFVVMEHVAGDPFPGRPTPCAWAELAGPLLSLLDVLARVHAAGVVHRDLKPANVLVHEGHAVLIDFGVARLDAPWHAAAPDAATWGTLAYMAPEAATGDDDPRSDLFAVGVMAFRALTGRFPFPVRGRPVDVLARRAHAPPPRWGAADVPPAARAELARLLSPRLDARPASALEAAARLRASSPRPVDDLRARLLAHERWGEADLRALFRGDDRLHHLREDAARLLLARTGGAGPRVAEELDRWEREGVARRADGGWVVRREGLDLAHQLAAPLQPARGAAQAHPDASELAEWLALAAVALPTAALPRLLGWPEARVRAALRRLRADGRVARERGRVRLAEGAAPPRRWAPERRREAHARVAAALPVGDEGRLLHLLQAGSDPAAIAGDVCVVAERLAARGQLARAETLLRESARALRGCRGVAVAHLEAVFGLWARVAVEQWTPHALDRLRYELAASAAGAAHVRAIASLLDAARATMQWTPQSGAIIARVRPFAEGNLEVVRREICVNAARRTSLEALRRVLAAFRRAPRAGAEEARRRSAWEARLANAEGRYRDAARGYERAAIGERWRSRRHREALSAASAWMEAGALGRARRIAEGVRASAERLRLPVAEGRAVWILRTIAWREGGAAEPDPAWVDAARAVDPVVARLMAFHEAALAWHARDAAGFRALFDLTRGIEGAVAEVRSFALLQAMAADLDVAPLDAEAREALIDRVAALVPAIALQVAALTARAGAPAPREAERALGFARSIPRERWGWRLDVLSVEECLARLGASPPTRDQ